MVDTFEALLWNDPNGPEDGVVQLDSVVHTDDTQEPAPISTRAIQLGNTNIGELISQGFLVGAPEPSMYLYSSGFRDAQGRAKQASAVLALANNTPNQPKSAANTLAIEALANLIEPIPVPVEAEGFESLLQPIGLPIARATTEDGTHHRLWPINQAGVRQTISEAAETALEIAAQQNPALAARLAAGPCMIAFHPASQPLPAPAIGMVIPQPQ